MRMAFSLLLIGSIQFVHPSRRRVERGIRHDCTAVPQRLRPTNTGQVHREHIAGATERLLAAPAMTYVVTESCIRCKYTDCVDVCPVDCFHEGPNFLVIDPDECIDCTLCVAECPVEAIFAEDDVPDEQREFIQLNAELAKVWKPLIEKKPAPDDADEPAGATV